ncbi:MAG: polysaccharide deacetylase family protein, partial [Firmicutes bacterium]|nr:polysaccharide deacetylase family protein [Bacillota bacterium]
PSAQRTEPAPEPAGGDAGTAISSAPPKTLPGVLPTIRPVLQGQGTAPANGKTIYLTIGDAPSPTTAELLAVLDELNVKATFFVVGSYVRKWPDALRAIYEHGHTIGNHAYSYDLQVLNASFSACLHDFQRAERMVADVLGFELPMPLLRIPYGSSKIPPLYRTRLQEEGYLWLDWNALNGDTESATKSDDDVIRRAISTAGRVEGDIVLLVNDNKQRTIRTLPAIVSHFREAGYVFRTLDYNTLEKIPDVRMGLPIKKQ